MNAFYLIKIVLVLASIGIMIFFIKKTKLTWINLFKLLKILLSITISTLWKIYTYNFVAECLAYKLSISQEIKYKGLIPKLFILLLTCVLSIFSLYAGIKLNNAQSNFLYIFSGALLGIVTTLFVDNIKSLMDRKEMLVTMNSFLSEEFRILQSIYESFLLEFPFDDKLFSNGEDIIYISPVNTPNQKSWLHEKKVLRFIEYYNKLFEENRLINIFYPEKLEKFITLICQNKLSLQELQSKLFYLSKFQNNHNTVFLEQLCNKINSLIDCVNKYKNWKNSDETKKELIQIHNILINKLVHAILCVQKSLNEYENYIKHCTKQLNLHPELKLEEIVRSNKYDDMKLKDIIKNEYSIFENLTN